MRLTATRTREVIRPLVAAVVFPVLHPPGRR